MNNPYNEIAATALALSRAGVVELRGVLWGVLCEQLAALGVPAQDLESVALAIEAMATDTIESWVATGD